jgi:hypothetical protein
VEERITLNQFAFRKANETIALRAGGDPIELLCECGRSDCAAKVTVTADEYDAVRAHPRRFLCAPGHVTSAIEAVVAEVRTAYIVVEKGGRAGELAEAMNPRV